ncbi:hypothetical protein ACTRXD_05400 [Nitrospira sp. T9]|uniref:hypothetical protein n=1 Tax=unclassified Nitrospira TaxID=2652172 RepID=UPI003F973637
MVKSDADRSPEGEYPSSPQGETLRHTKDRSGMLPERPAPQMKELGITPLARHLELTEEQTNGHWCSRCQGIWYGYTLETQCPACGNRRG